MADPNVYHRQEYLKPEHYRTLSEMKSTIDQLEMMQSQYLRSMTNSGKKHAIKAEESRPDDKFTQIRFSVGQGENEPPPSKIKRIDEDRSYESSTPSGMEESSNLPLDSNLATSPATTTPMYEDNENQESPKREGETSNAEEQEILLQIPRSSDMPQEDSNSTSIPPPSNADKQNDSDDNKDIVGMLNNRIAELEKQLEEAVAGKPVNVLQILGAKRELAAKQDECMEFQRSIGLERIDFKKKEGNLNIKIEQQNGEITLLNQANDDYHLENIKLRQQEEKLLFAFTQHEDEKRRADSLADKVASLDAENARLKNSMKFKDQAIDSKISSIKKISALNEQARLAMIESDKDESME